MWIRRQSKAVSWTVQFPASGTNPLEKGLDSFFSRIVLGERRRWGVGLLTAPWFSASVLEVFPLNLRNGEQISTIVWTYAPNSKSEDTAFFRILGTVLEKCPCCGLHCSTRTLQPSHGQWQSHLEACDREQQPAWSEPEWCSVVGFLSASHSRSITTTLSTQ